MDENKVPEKTKLKNYIKYYQIQEDIEEQSKLVEESDGFFDKFTPYYVSLLSFYILVILIMASVGMMTLQLIDSDYSYQILQRSFIAAVSPDQDINTVMYTDVIQIVNFNENKVTPGDNVVIFGDYNIDEYWVEEVTEMDFVNREITLTYDQLSTNTYSFDDVVGTFEKEANIIGTILYTAKFPTGYMWIVASHIFILVFYYLSVVNPKKEPSGLKVDDEEES